MGRLRTPTREQENQRGANKETPLFCFRWIQKKFGPKELESKVRSQVSTKLCAWGAQTWQHLAGLPREAGFEMMATSALNAKLPADLKGHDQVLVFRLSQKARMAGVRVHRTLHIVWLDDKSRLYPH